MKREIKVKDTEVTRIELVEFGFDKEYFSPAIACLAGIIFVVVLLASGLVKDYNDKGVMIAIFGAFPIIITVGLLVHSLNKYKVRLILPRKITLDIPDLDSRIRHDCNCNCHLYDNEVYNSEGKRR